MKATAIPSLDGIRAISVFIVLFSHAGLGHVIPGGFGVTTFFFLSGYLITTLLLVEYKNNGQINFRYFFARRFLRLFPPLLITLFISYMMVATGVLGGGLSWIGSLSQIFYLANYHIIFHWPGSIPDGTGILWSLAVEEHFYLLFPFLFYVLIHKYGQRNTAAVLFLICMMVLVWRCGLVFYYQVEPIRTYYATDTRIDSILYGCIMAMVWNPGFKEAAEKMRWQEYILLLVSIMLLLLSFLYRDEQFRETFRYTLQGLALIPLFYLAIRYPKNSLFRFLNYWWMKKLGVYSYFIYLSHFIVIHALKDNDIVETIPLLIILSSAICITYSFCVDRYFDKYFRRLRAAFRQ